MDQIDPAKRRIAYTGIIETLLIDTIARRFETEDALLAWAAEFNHAATTAADRRDDRALGEAYDYVAGEMLAAIRSHWRLLHPDVPG